MNLWHIQRADCRPGLLTRHPRGNHLAVKQVKPICLVHPVGQARSNQIANQPWMYEPKRCRITRHPRGAIPIQDLLTKRFTLKSYAIASLSKRHGEKSREPWLADCLKVKPGKTKICQLQLPRTNNRPRFGHEIPHWVSVLRQFTTLH